MFLAALTAWVTTKTKTAGRGVIEALDVHSLGVSRHGLAIGLLWTYVYMPLPIYGTLVDFADRLYHAIFALRLAHHDQHHRAIARRLAAGVDGLRREFPDDLPAHSLPLLRPGFIAGWIILATILFARVQHLGLSLFAGSRTVGAAALSLLRRRQFGAHVFAGA